MQFNSKYKTIHNIAKLLTTLSLNKINYKYTIGRTHAYATKPEADRQTDRQRQRERQHTQSDRDRDRQTDRQKDRDRQTDRQTDRD